MSTPGPYWGSDKRLFPRLTAWLQNLATFKSQIPPPALILEVLGFRLYVPIGRDKYWMLRIHLWRWDAYNHAYIFFSSAAKRVDPKLVMP
jgi:hypothetical protein